MGFILGGFWLAGGRMLIGMGLMKLDVFSGRRSRRFYIWLVLLGYGIGLPLVAYDAYELIRTNFGFSFQLHGGIFLNFFGSVLVALGHVGALMLIYKAGAADVADKPAGRRGPHGAEQLSDAFDRLHDAVLRLRLRPVRHDQPDRAGGDRAGDLDVQLIVSPIWLKQFRFGPAEWLWRSLTYWRLQPMRVEGRPKRPGGRVIIR